MTLKDAMNYARPFVEQGGVQGQKTRALVALCVGLAGLERCLCPDCKDQYLYSMIAEEEPEDD